jgi:FkbM family methyltransferase
LERHDDSRGRGGKPFRAEGARPRHDRELREAFFSQAAELTPYLGVEADGDLFLVATDDAGIGRRLFVNGIRGDMAHLRTAVRLLEELGVPTTGSTFVDVGANIGTTTVTALRRHRFARAVALEPAPSNFHVLRLNLVANEVESDVTALQVAVTDKEGEEQLVLSGAGSGSHVLAPAVPKTPASTVLVQAVTLDGLVARGLLDPAAVGLLWIDAAGHESEVLTGASKLVDAGVPLVAALRTRSDNWPETKEFLLRHLSGYTDFAELRLNAQRTDDLGALLDSIQRPSTDLLAVRRPR